MLLKLKQKNTKGGAFLRRNWRHLNKHNGCRFVVVIQHVGYINIRQSVMKIWQLSLKWFICSYMKSSIYIFLIHMSYLFVNMVSCIACERAIKHVLRESHFIHLVQNIYLCLYSYIKWICTLVGKFISASEVLTFVLFMFIVSGVLKFSNSFSPWPNDFNLRHC